MSRREALMKLEDRIAQASIRMFPCGCKVATMPGQQPIGIKCQEHKDKEVIIKLPKK